MQALRQYSTGFDPSILPTLKVHYARWSSVKYRTVHIHVKLSQSSANAEKNSFNFGLVILHNKKLSFLHHLKYNELYPVLLRHTYFHCRTRLLTLYVQYYLYRYFTGPRLCTIVINNEFESGFAYNQFRTLIVPKKLPCSLYRWQGERVLYSSQIYSPWTGDIVDSGIGLTLFSCSQSGTMNRIGSLLSLVLLGWGWRGRRNSSRGGRYVKRKGEARSRILGRNWEKSLKSFLLAIHSHLYSYWFLPPPPPPPLSKVVWNWFVM